MAKKSPKKVPYYIKEILINHYIDIDKITHYRFLSARGFGIYLDNWYFYVEDEDIRIKLSLESSKDNFITIKRVEKPRGNKLPIKWANPIKSRKKERV